MDLSKNAARVESVLGQAYQGEPRDVWRWPPRLLQAEPAEAGSKGTVTLYANTKRDKGTVTLYANTKRDKGTVTLYANAKRDKGAVTLHANAKRDKGGG